MTASYQIEISPKHYIKRNKQKKWTLKSCLANKLLLDYYFIYCYYMSTKMFFFYFFIIIIIIITLFSLNPREMIRPLHPPVYVLHLTPTCLVEAILCGYIMGSNTFIESGCIVLPASVSVLLFFFFSLFLLLRL